MMGEEYLMGARLMKMGTTFTSCYSILDDVIKGSEIIASSQPWTIFETKSHFSSVLDLMDCRNLNIVNQTTGNRPLDYRHILSSPSLNLTTRKNVSQAQGALLRLNLSDTSLKRQDIQLPAELLREWATISLQSTSNSTPLSRYAASQ